MSIFDKLFGSAPAAATPVAPANAANPGAGQPGNIPPTQSVQPTDGNGTIPAGTPAPAASDVGTPAASPLDTFSSLWQPDANAEPQQPIINIDPKSIAEAASKTNFTKMITPEQMQAISAGGEGAVQAFMQSMNTVAQGVYAQSAFATSKIVEQAIEKAQQRFTSEIPNHVKKLSVSDALRSENPALNHPAASPILGALEQQLTTKYPNASASELTQMAKQYLENFANMATQPQQQAAAAASAAAKPKETDWSQWTQ